MTDLVEWLRVQIAEDRRLAELAPQDERVWNADGCSVIVDHPTNQVVDYCYDDVSGHIANWDPKRALAECDAKLAILDTILPGVEGMESQIDQEWGLPSDPRPEYESELLVKLLALPYADRPGYREEWKP